MAEIYPFLLIFSHFELTSITAHLNTMHTGTKGVNFNGNLEANNSFNLSLDVTP